MASERVDVLAYLDAQIASHKSLSSDAFHVQELPKVEAIRAAVAELIEAASIVSNFDGLHTKNLRAMPFAGEAMTKMRVAVNRAAGLVPLEAR